ncbi:mandelate racemase/muconate lactonizing enzyme family protein [Paralcaligenes sp. KSB-10]|uniref:mandelate racemase/muconate lactonizing enzyme family protein n=1 Tax=Paralcaligenes sp. KSB-10 TaxID=2901142 RepID=UPI001E5C0970|nr:mandelate racemase/muconate lactonizing enzyme family protein [Paralcaligenes sp. KSB-10]UHL65257.1 mandelate racemase/muconate lactonizing enzyme family protein [Paralcaligenes sp. KSB-10]
MIIERAVVRQLSFPLITPYKLSMGNLHLFDPIVLELLDKEGRSGWGECLIIPGYTEETVEGSWNTAIELGERLKKVAIGQAHSIIAGYGGRYPGMASTAYAALDMLCSETPFSVDKETRVPLLAPCQAHEAHAIRDEIDALLEAGFGTLKIKVGYKWQDDLDRMSIIQGCVAGRASLRLDANQGYSNEDGQSFASRLHPQGIELLEQPCASADWEANARVAAVSTVPVMLDESIYKVSDIDRAATIPNVGYVKLKLKKIGSAQQLSAALQRIRDLGMTPVLGDGVSIELGCWMEACVAAKGISNAGEMNGFLKTRTRLFENPLPFTDGAIHLPAGYWPRIDRSVLNAHTLRMRDIY